MEKTSYEPPPERTKVQNPRRQQSNWSSSCRRPHEHKLKTSSSPNQKTRQRLSWNRSSRG
uniref:Uncharacterized protein n=1 Tax=Arundo donax TaxID=35708 RepID=A0A0A9DAM8_ARUDO